MAINWNLLGNQQGQFQNALAMGAQFGAAAAERRNKKEYTNALLDVFSQGGSPQGGAAAPPMGGGQGIVATPEQQAESERLARHFGMEGALADGRAESMAVIARQNPQLFVQLQQQAAAQQQAARQSEIQQRASQGDPQAMLELAGIDVQAWNTLDKANKAQIALIQEQRGNAALDALRSGNPRAAVEAYAQNSGDNEAAGLLQLSDQELVAALRSEVAEANMIKDLLDREEPNWRVIPQGGVVVDVNNPQAVGQFSGGGAVSVSSPQEAAALPPGTRYTTPDGQEYIR